MKPELVIFDMDGVVFDSEKVYYTANKMAADELGITYSMDYYRRFIGAGNEQMMTAMTEDLGDASLVRKFMERSFSLINPLVMEGKLELKKGFLELTSSLQASRTPYVLASSNDRKQIDFYLRTLKMDLGFNLIISADDVSQAKPSPEIFNQAWQKAGHPVKEKTLVIEDSHNGILAANRAQIPVAMVPDLIQPTDYDTQNTFGVFHDLNELTNLLN
ncbi:HAD family hydrolase [Ligilactobacillus pobuzihii]|uniref:HAD superfamily hydrolase n=1 Tax=Ligilactobacillus pobuzihii TaxID=449659 RepID=A0A0R2LHK3_9LACO|nr:HAD family phosphatase [Ligilactobacillus pobuzihii]KRK10830.1 HAD superfamily hydrolase [Ligilactobacillus pobuzihii E100301 = KCTC 13174]KRO01046.1 HAD superfamily hydrolase [Ligilactobacillus pobuzihii]GEN47878.1 haloacid dehalogenase [Ligilactobacillus pobuzihii]